MRIYLAGGYGGNLSPFFRVLKEWSREGIDEAMRIYLADTGGIMSCYISEFLTDDIKPYYLESFYYADAGLEKMIPMLGDFMLDSGAFTFMMNAHTECNWEEYIERYSDFIVRNKVDKFFELDIDSVVGYDKVIKYRKRLEKLTGKQPIPVWHSPRGIDEYKRHCDEYPYVALGGIVGKEWKQSAEKYMPWFIKEAHKRGAKIHALGYTKLNKLGQYHFDSVDSSTWTIGNRYGRVFKFDGRTIRTISKPDGYRLANARIVAVNNFMEWVKFQRYAEKHF